MVTARTPLIAGNWKMHFDHLQSIAFVQKLAWTLKDGKHDFDAVEVAVFPPFTDLRSVQTLVTADKLPVRYGAQDLSSYDAGAHTGEVSGAFLSALECRYALVGHSERRMAHGDDDVACRDKVAAAGRHGLVPVLCVGETSDDLEQHGPAAIPVAQLRRALEGNDAVTELVVAYEPVWAIGSGQPATAEQAQSVCRALRETLAELRGDAFAAATRVLYGGSVKAENIVGFMREPDIDGALVGGASLSIEEFASICRYRQHAGV